MKIKLAIKAISISSIFSFILLIAPIYSICGDSLYSDKRISLTDSCVKILADNGVCDINECSKYNYILSSGMTGGISISTYEINDVKIINKIISLCIEEYNNNNGEFSIKIRSYKYPHDQVIGIKGLFVYPYMKFTIKGTR